MRPAAAENTGQKAKRRIPHLSQTANNDLSARRSRVAIKVMTWVWEQSRSKKTERLVLLAIADCASEDGANAYPSMAELRRKTGLSERGVQSAIGSLVKLGELFVGRNMGPRGCNRYRVIMATPADSAGVQAVHPADPAPPRRECTPQAVREAADPAPRTPQTVRETPAAPAPGTVPEPSIEPSGKRRRRGTRIPDPFTVTPDMVAWARENCPTVDGRRETEKFINYWTAKTGANATKLDWVATWKNWMLTAAERSSNGRASPHRPYRDPADVSIYHGEL
jgi:DNA-binding MarR family transcriptional regulator